MAMEDSRGIQEASLAAKLNQPEPESVFSLLPFRRGLDRDTRSRSWRAVLLLDSYS